MSSKWIATVLFTMLTVSSTSCSDSASTAKDYLAKNKTSAASGDQKPGAGDKSDSGDANEGSGGSDGTDDENNDDNDGNDSGGSKDETPKDDGSMEPVKETPDPVDPTPKPDPKPVDPTPVPDPKPMEPATTTYADINTKFFAKYCTQCHGTKGGVNLQSYAKVKQYLAAIKAEVITTSNMPQGALQPSAAELKLLSDWIEAGGPEK